MYVVTVAFVVKPEHAAAFSREVVANARLSRDMERGCRQFDVCAAPDDPTSIFLYEVYTDRAAFDAHLATAHFRAFDAMVGAWVASKTVRTFQRIEA
jgi:(4S)-4-hydroxy-5-phosphonooxypentane-2,3-dione isomerase